MVFHTTVCIPSYHECSIRGLMLASYLSSYEAKTVNHDYIQAICFKLTIKCGLRLHFSSITNICNYTFHAVFIKLNVIRVE